MLLEQALLALNGLFLATAGRSRSSFSADANSVYSLLLSGDPARIRRLGSDFLLDRARVRLFGNAQVLDSLTEVKMIAELGWRGFTHHLLGLGPKTWQFLRAPVSVLVTLRSLTDRVRVVLL